MSKRKNYSPSFKAKVALEAIKNEKTQAELSQIYQVHQNLIGKWKKQALENFPGIFGGEIKSQENIDKPLKDLGYDDNVYFAENTSPEISKEQSNVVKIFKKQVDNFLKNPVKNKGQLNLGDTPQALIEAGLEQLPMETATHVINKVLGGKKNHDADIETVKNLPNLLKNPIAVFQSNNKNKPNHILVLTEALDKKGLPVLAAIEKNNTQNKYTVNFVASAYGRKENFFKGLIEKNKLIKLNKNNIPSWLQAVNNPSSSSRDLNLSPANVNQKQDINNNITYYQTDFNPNTDNIYYQADINPAGVKGSFDTATNTISIFEKTNASTIIHELGHMFLNDIQNLAKTNEQAKADLVEINNWLNHYEGEYTTAQHEKFARGLEAYVMSGKAPNSRLKNAFEAFRHWLLEIYGSVKNLGIEINPETTKLFQRLFTTSDEENKAKHDQAKELLRKAIQKGNREANSRIKKDVKGIIQNLFTTIVNTELGTNYDLKRAVIEYNKAKKNGADKSWGTANNYEELVKSIFEHENKDAVDFVAKELYIAKGLLGFDNAEFVGNALNLYGIQAWDHIASPEEINKYADLDGVEKQYAYILKSYEKSADRTIELMAFSEWLDTIDENFRDDFNEQWGVDTAFVDRKENTDKFNYAKETIIRNASKMAHPDSVQEYENVIKSAFSALKFLTATDRQKLLFNILSLKTVESLKNNIDNIMDVAKTMEDVGLRRVLGVKIHKIIQISSKDVKQGSVKKGRYDFETNKIFKELRELDKLNTIIS